MKRLAILVAVMTTLAAPTTYAADPPPGPTVTVVNTPLPVTVQGQTTPIPVSVTNSSINSNVTVTNPATNPVKTSIDAFPRTPFATCLLFPAGCPISVFNVPSDQRLVIETVSLSITCSPGMEFHMVLRLGPVQLVLPVVGDPDAVGSIIQNVRVVVDHDQQVAIGSSGGQGGCAPETTSVSLAGYLISVNSPSLAP